MAATSILTGDSYTAKLYATKGWIQAMQQSVCGMLFNKGGVYFPPELMGADNRGDQLTFNYFGKLNNAPIGEGETADGNEEAVQIKTHSMVMNETRIPVLIPNYGIEKQRLKQNLETIVTGQIANRAVELMDTSVFTQLAGVNQTSFTLNGTTYSTTAKKLHVQGHNTPVAPTTNRIVRAAGAATDQALTSSDTFTLALIDYALEKNAVSDQPIEPMNDGYFYLFLSPYDVTNLKHDAGSAIQWLNLQTAMISGGKASQVEGEYVNNIPYLGVYNNVKIFQAGRVAYGQNSSTSAVITTVRRNVLVGKNALSFASPYGGRVSDTDVPFRFQEQLKDYGKYKGILAEMVYGLKKMSPTDKEDIGSFVIGTYAASHA